MDDALDIGEIWRDDLLGRKADAESLIAFIGTAANRPPLGGDHKALVMAVDAEYGVGKSFFLQRLERQLRSNHPVAFVDAWADDVSDEPLVAIAATLQVALAPFLGKANVRKAFGRVVSATGAIIKIGAIGAAKRIAGLAITSGAVDLIEQTVKDISEDEKDTAGKLIEESAKEALDSAQGVLAELAPDKLMRDRIARFKERRDAVQSLKESLRALVSALDKGAITAPIVIIIDELDRCRPTYAIKLLEEIKHLFDVEGLVFLLGLNLDQLARSAKALYGHEFDGASYLRRFIGRRYRLRDPELGNLFRYLLAATPELEQKLVRPPTRFHDRTRDVELADVLACYLRAYNLHARDAFQIFDRLFVAARLTGDVPLLLPYILPLVISDLKGAVRGAIVDPPLGSPLGYQEEWWDDGNHRERTVGFEQLYKEMHTVAFLVEPERSRVRNQERHDLAQEWVFRIADWASARKVPLGNPRNYADLLDTVGAFETAAQP